MSDERPGTRSPDTLGTRLVLSFLGVALTAVGLLALLTVIFASADASRLVSMQRTDLTGAIASAAGAAWDRHNSWAGADLEPTLALAANTGADVQILTRSGAIVASSRKFALSSGEPEFRAPVIVGRQDEGDVVVRFNGSGLGAADHALRTAAARHRRGSRARRPRRAGIGHRGGQGPHPPGRPYRRGDQGDGER